MTTTPEELKKKQQEEDLRVATKSRFTRLAQFHEKEAAHYNKKAADCDVFELAPQPPADTFGGL